MSASNVSFAHGVASGDPYADSVILWTRISPPEGLVGSLDVQWQIATSADFAPGSIKGSGSFSTSAARDWTVKVEAAGLSADTTYFYRFSSGNTGSSVGQTKTLPVGSDPVRLAVLSCANFPAAQQFDAYARAAVINSANPYDAWLQVGDYIYEYGPGGYGTAEDAAGSRGFLPNREILSLDDYRERYAHYHTDPGLQALRAAAPLIAIWDDHETANDSWKGGAENHQSATEGDWIARRDAALKAYYEWIPIREPGQRQPSDGATASSPLTQGYRSFSFGEVLALHMLETRLTARDQQLQYPDAAAVQARIGAILADPTQVASYATKAGIAPPTSAAAIPAFATALAPLVTQELVIAIVQKAWGDPNRDLIGDTQMAWLQQQMASSSAAWQVLGQQVLMQSMAVPTELLLNAGNPALLDKFAGPLQKLATGTPFASLSPAEQALFAEAGKIPYNLDAWDGYGVERETILQTALALGKRLISLAGDTHNAWAGVLDTMSAGSKPVGTLAGVEYGTPGVTSPGFEKYLPGADAYIRAKYPAVDGLDGLFLGYVNGLKYADLNRRGFLDLTVSKEQAVGSFQFLNGTDAISGQPLWSSESVVSSASYGLSTTAEARPLITWQPGWRELDLVFGMAVDGADGSTLLDPAAYASVPREGIQLADVTVQGSAAADRIYVGVGSTVDVGPGSDELFNTDSLGGNRLVGGIGSDRFFLRPVNDVVIGGQLISNPSAFGSPFTARADRQGDSFLIDSSDVGSPGVGSLRILDFEAGLDQLLLDGQAPVGDWAAIRAQLKALNININAVPELAKTPSAITLKRGLEVVVDLAGNGRDPDGDSLQIIKLSGPDWITTSGTSLRATAPTDLSHAQLAGIELLLGLYDGTAVTPFLQPLAFNAAPTAIQLTSLQPLPENTSTAAAIKLADFVIIDDELGNESISITGDDANYFLINANSVYLKSGVSLDYEAKSSYRALITALDPELPGSEPVTAELRLLVADVNEAPTSLLLANRVGQLDENILIRQPLRVADFVIRDDALGTETISISGNDASAFQVIGESLYLRQGVSLDFEKQSSYEVRLSVTDPSLPASLPLQQDFQLAIRDGNDAPSAIRLVNRITSLPDNISIASPLRVADIEIVDDRLGDNRLSLVGQDAGSFVIRDRSLFLKQGVDLDVTVKSSYRVSVAVDDPSLGDSPDASIAFELAITAGRQRERGQLEVSLPNSGGVTREIPITFSGADLLPGTTLHVLSDLGLQAAALKTLADLKVTPSGGGIDFSLALDSGLNAGRLSSLLDLVGSDLVGDLSDGAGRIPTRRLLYYSLDGSGAIAPLSFDPIQGGGARFYDLSGDGVADFFTLSLVDGGFGDKDAAVNGIIKDPSFAAVADLDPVFTAATSGFLNVVDPASDQLRASVALRMTITSLPQTSNSLYYVLLNQDELANPNAILGNLNSLRSRARLLASTLESTDFTLPAGTKFQREILLLNGQAVRLFEVADGSLADIRSLSDSRLRFLDPSSVTKREAQFSSLSGVSLNLSVVTGDQGLNALVGQQQSLAPVLDLSAFRATQTVSGTVAIGREAKFDTVTGFYRCLDASGAVRAADGVSIVRPGDVNYQAEALRAANQVAGISALQVGDRQTNSRPFNLNESTAIAPFARVGGDTYFAYDLANVDGISHFRTLGTNLFGFEDQLRGGDLDFDDMVIGFNFTKVV